MRLYGTEVVNNDAYLECQLGSAGLLRVHSFTHAKEFDRSIAVLAHRSVRALIVPQDVGGSPLDCACLLVPTRLCDAIAQGLRKARNDGRVVASKIVQLDRLGRPVIFFRILRGADENVFVVLVDIAESEQGNRLFDDATLTGWSVVCANKVGYDSYEARAI